MKKPVIVSAVLVSLTALSVTLAEPWDGYNSPEKMGRGRYNYDFQELPKSGRLANEKMPWADTYFPTYKGGIAYRWQLGNPKSTWSYALHSKEDLAQMGPEAVAKLSPAEKFDIWMGDYSYPTVRSERARTSPDAATWAGLCHGWSPAAIHHREPAPVTVTNADGIEVRFGSSDVKALLTYYYGKVNWKPTGWTGKKCRGDVFGGRGCKGVNPATLHLVMTNQIGLLGESFIMDRDRKREIWNQPFFGYSFSNLGSCGISGAAMRAGASHGVLVSMRGQWIDELDRSQWEPDTKIDLATGEWKANSKSTVWRYCLELSPSGRIVGGEWESKTRPGFIWNHEINDFADPYYGKVKDLLVDAVPAPMPSPSPSPSPSPRPRRR